MKKLYLLIALMLISLSIVSAPLKNVNVTLTQPNGEVIHCFASGDEYYNYLHDANGFTIVQDESGYYVYATKNAEGKVIPTSYIVNSVDPATVGLQPYAKISAKEYYARRQQREEQSKNRITKDGEQVPNTTRTSKKFPNGRELNHGLYNNLVVFIRFAGDTYHTSSFSTVEAMFNADGYDDNSLHNYYHHTSYNQLDLWSHFYPQPDGETILSYEDIYPKQYYQPYDPVTNPMGYQDGETADREFSMLERAIHYVEEMVPDSLDLDYNGDGMVDNVVFVIKGEPGEWASLLWPHRWSIYDRYVPLNGLQVFDFNLQLEQGGYFNVSTLCHEMFHSLGAPDLYHYNEGIDPVGPWDLMCGTSEPPQQTSSYMKYKYGNWVDEIPVINWGDPDNHGTYELESVSWEGGRRNGFMIPVTNEQYFYVEYRDKSNIFEREIPNSGILIYRIDTRFDGNASWNGYNYLDEVYLFRPGGSPNQAGNLDHAYFSEESGRTSFNYSTNPYPFINNQPYEFYDPGFEITNIRKTGNRMCFDLLPYGGEFAGPLVNHFTANVNSLEHQVELSWDSDTLADYYKVYRDGMEIASVTENSFVHPYTEADNGYHVYSVRMVSGGMMHVYHALTDTWVILGDYETIRLSLQCDSPYGTKGGELEVSFSNPSMKQQYFTLYDEAPREDEFYVPAGTEVNFLWNAGFDPEGEGIHVTATHLSQNSQGTIFDIDGPFQGLLSSYVVAEGSLGIITPQNLSTTPENGNTRLHWTVPTENSEFKVFRDRICIQPNLSDYSYLDEQLCRSGCHRYCVVDAADDNPTWSHEIIASIMTFYYEPPQNLQGMHVDGSQPHNELSWEAPQFIGHGMLAFDDNHFEDQMGSKKQKFGIKIEPQHLSSFEGLPLTHLEMFDCSAGEYAFKIYNGETPENESLLYSQNHTMTGSQTFVRFAMDEEVPFDTSLPLWVIVEPNNVEKPIPYGAFVGDDNSCMVRLNGNWRPITHYDQYHTWLLRAYTRPLDAKDDFSYQVYVGPEEAEDQDMAVAFPAMTATTLTHDTDENLRYNVTALINGKETDFSNTILLGPSVSIEEKTVANAVQLYPNPTRDLVTIKAHGLNRVTVFNLMGQMMETRAIDTDETVLDLSNYEPAMYLLRVVTENGSYTERIIKEL